MLGFPSRTLRPLPGLRSAETANEGTTLGYILDKIQMLQGSTCARKNERKAYENQIQAPLPSSHKITTFVKLRLLFLSKSGMSLGLLLLGLLMKLLHGLCEDYLCLFFTNPFDARLRLPIRDTATALRLHEKGAALVLQSNYL